MCNPCLDFPFSVALAMTFALTRRPANPLERGFAALTVLFALIAPWCHTGVRRDEFVQLDAE